MKALLLFQLWCALVFQSFGDTVTLASGRVVNGLILQTNATNIVMRTDIGVFAYPLLIVKEAKSARPEAEDFRPTARLPDERNLLLLLGKQPWASYLKQIPATVIDTGILRSVPYVSYRCGEDYEVNIYGDLSAPAGIEIGIYRGLISDSDAQRNCLEFISGLLGQPDDKGLLQRLDRGKDKKTRNGLTFEITPPSDPDSYGGWWVSAYSEKDLILARASDAELKEISVAKSQHQTGPSTLDNPSWSVQEIKLSRQSRPTTISFLSPSGEAVTNAEVVRVIDGVGLIWRKGASGGFVKLADLREELRTQFGYDPAKAAAADEIEQARKASEFQAAQPRAPAMQTQNQVQPALSPTAANAPDYGNGAYSGSSGFSRSPSYHSPEDRVFVHSYSRKDGTYVSSHTRSYPSRK